MHHFRAVPKNGFRGRNRQHFVPGTPALLEKEGETLGNRTPGSLSKVPRINLTMKKNRVIESKTTAPSRKTLAPSHADIAAKAAAIWERKGRPEGRDQEIWLEAERLLAQGLGNTEAESDELDALFPSSQGGASTSL
jgi:DUF2934 family protein